MKNNLIRFLILINITLFSCNKEDNNPSTNMDYKEKMREFVIGISQYSKSIKPGFIVIPQNGIELVTDNGDISGEPNTEYLNAIDGNGQEDLFYGYDNDNQATPTADNSYLRSFLDIARNKGKTILVTDYCWDHDKMSNSYLKNENAGYISFAANRREISNIPDFPIPIHGENDSVISNLSEVRNFLYLINPNDFSSKVDFINAVTATNYDLLIMDLFYNDGIAFTDAEITQLRNKANGGKRLVIAYMSIGEAEDYRYYWHSDWVKGNPKWLDKENPDWEGNYKVKYWFPEWQDIIYGNNDSYLKKIIDAKFDGVYLDIIYAFEFYEN